jgi:hypothetical protein
VASHLLLEGYRKRLNPLVFVQDTSPPAFKILLNAPYFSPSQRSFRISPHCLKPHPSSPPISVPPENTGARFETHVHDHSSRSHRTDSRPSPLLSPSSRVSWIKTHGDARATRQQVRLSRPWQRPVSPTQVGSYPGTMRQRPSGRYQSRPRPLQCITNISTIVANAAFSTAMGGTPSHDTEDKFTCTPQSHDRNGEIYIVAFSRDKIRFSSFEADTIRTSPDSWADGIPALA